MGQSSTPIILETSTLTHNQSNLIGQSMNTHRNPIGEGTSSLRNCKGDSSSSHAQTIFSDFFRVSTILLFLLNCIYFAHSCVSNIFFAISFQDYLFSATFLIYFSLCASYKLLVASFT